jgi:hypothetical protein
MKVKDQTSSFTAAKCKRYDKGNPEPYAIESDREQQVKRR